MKNPAAQALGRLGGIQKAKTHSKAEYVKSGLKGGKKLLKLRGREYYRRIGRLGGLQKAKNKANSH